PGGRRLGAHAPLLVDDVALGVELAENGLEQAVGLHPEPELELVGGHGDEEGGQVLCREGVLAGGAGAGVDGVELVLDHEPALLVDELLKLLLELRQLRAAPLGAVGIGDLAVTPALALLAIELADLLLELLLLVDDLEVALDVGGADDARALEQHVLEE